MFVRLNVLRTPTEGLRRSPEEYGLHAIATIAAIAIESSLCRLRC
jgi:hypothetical protein